MGNDPLNKTDPTGEFAQAGIGFAVGFGFNIALQLLEGKELSGEGEEEIDWDEAIVDGAIGATGFGLVRVLKPDFDSSWIRGSDFCWRDNDMGVVAERAVYLGV